MKVFLLDAVNIAKEVFDNESVMINIPTGKYYSVRGSAGVRILELLEQPVHQESIVNSILNEYDVSRSDAETGVQVFLQQLENEFIILESKEKAVDVPTPGSPAKQVFQTLALEVYDDMQELIMLDPVHDVESFKGWPQKKDGSVE